MPASFWFEVRGTETYYRHTLKVERHYYDDDGVAIKVSNKTALRNEEGRPYYETSKIDWNKTEECTKADYEIERFAQSQPGATYIDNRIWQRRKKLDLQQVDELICEFMGEDKPTMERDSLYYTLVHEFGFWTLYELGGSFIGDKESQVKGDHMAKLHDKVDGFIKNVLDKNQDDRIGNLMKQEGYRARIHALVDWVFVTKFEFHACG